MQLAYAFHFHVIVIFVVMPKLLPMTTGEDLYMRYGAIIAMAEITHALAEISTSQGKLVLLMKNICELSPLQILITLIIVFKVICKHIKTLVTIY